jgi:hypothetical protein
MTRVQLHPLCLGRGQRSQRTNYFKNQKHSLESLQLVFGVIYDSVRVAMRVSLNEITFRAITQVS